MQLWLPWLPRGIRALFSDLVITNIGKARWNPVVAWDTRLLSLFDGFRYHFAGFFGGLATFLLWPKRDNWKNLSHLRVIVFLGVLLVSLSALHLWASIYLDYCVYCFSGYIAFFYVVAVLLVVAAVGVWRKTANGLQQILLGLSVLAICGGVGYSAFADLGDPLLALSVPRFKDGRVMPGLTTLWETISNKFILPRDAAEKIVSAAAGLVVGIVLLLVALQVFRWLKGRNLSYGYVLGITVLIMGFALSPILAGSGIRPDCPSTNVIAANEQVGRYLQQSLPPGSKVYWNGGLSVAPLLYVPGIKIYPAQINDGYSFRVGGDPERVLKYGFWNAALSRQWLADADFVILEAWRYSAMQATLLANHFVELSRAPVPTSCADGSQLMIFHKEINGFITDRPRIQ
jgi:hypothetical protein